MKTLLSIIIICVAGHIILATAWTVRQTIRDRVSVDRSVANILQRRVRVLCWVMTQPMYHETRAEHVQATWGKRCNKLVFMSTFHVENTSVPIVMLPVKEGKDNLWGKTKEAFRYVYEHYREDADWFLKADDDTYVVVENLRYMLADHNPRDPIYFGCRFKAVGFPEGYMSGGAGYVLSREALDRFVTKGLTSPRLCRDDDQGPEDAELGICLYRIGVTAMDSRDQLKRGRFFPFPPEDHLIPKYQGINYWYWSVIFYPTNEGLDCCSDHAITFHYIKPSEMYVYDYLIYQLRPYGVSYGLGKLPKMFGNDTAGNAENQPLLNNY